MGSIGTFGSFTQARLGIYAAQTGLRVTGNNIANINTEGYTRQRLDQESFRTGGADRYHSAYSIRVGNGVLTTGVSQLRDPYLDIRYRSEMASVGFMDTKLGGLEGVQAILDEVGDGDEAFGIIEAQLSDIYDALQQLTDQTGHSEYDIQVRSSADALCKQFNAYAAKLEELYNNTVDGFEEDLRSVNSILTNIRDLNTLIRKNELHGDNALELKDQRNLLIDELSEYMKIDVIYTEEDIGAGQTVEKLTIKLADANPDATVKTDSSPLVDGIYATQIYYPKVNEKYDPTETDETQPGFGKYLISDGKTPPTYTGTNDPAKATQEFDEHFTLTLDALKDKHGALLYTMDKMTERPITQAQYGNGQATSVLNRDGSTTITTYRSESISVLTTNPAFDPNLPVSDTNAKFLKDANDPTSFTNDYMEAARRTLTTYYATDYVRTPSQIVELDDNDLYGSLQATRELLTESGEFASSTTITGVDENAATKRGIPYYQKALDLLANKIAATFNEQNQGFVFNENGQYVDANDNPLTWADGTPATTASRPLTDAQKQHLRDNGGIEMGSPLFSLRGDLNTDEMQVTNPDGTTTTTYINASNISISAAWASGPQLVTSFMKPTSLEIGSTDSGNIEEMVYLFTKKMDYAPSTLDPADPTLNTEPMFNGSFQEMWVNIGSVLGNDMKVTTTMLDTYYASSVSLDTSRDSVSSVDLNDEAMNLMQYSRSYQAACRLMTTLDSVLDKLINGTGVIT